MARVPRKNRTRRLHRLALAAIGLITLNCASPAWGTDNLTIDSDGPVIPSNHVDGLGIQSTDSTGTTATWAGSGSISTNPVLAGGLKFLDGGAGTGDAILLVSGPGLFVVENGGIKNENTSSDSFITIDTAGAVFMVDTGNIEGNATTDLIIQHEGGAFMANNSDVTGNVEFRDTKSGPVNNESTFVVQSIGENGQATVTVSTGDSGDTARLSAKTLGSANNSAATDIILSDSGAIVNVTDRAVGSLNVKNRNSGTFSLNTLAHTGNLTLDGQATISRIEGTVSIQATDGATGDVHLKDGGVYADLGDANTDMNLTLGRDANASATETLNLNIGDKIVGSADGSASTTLNINTATADIVSTNPANTGSKADVAGHVKINLIEGSNVDLELGELTKNSHLTVFEETAGTNDKSVTFLTANKDNETISIVNTTENDKAVLIHELSGGILQVGGGGAANTAPKASSVWVTDLVYGDTLEIASQAGDYGQVTIEAAALDTLDPVSNTTITLKNAILKIAEGEAHDIDMGWNGNFTMDSTDGDSHLLIGDQGSTNIGNKVKFENAAPTITVGAGGDVIIESYELTYNKALESSDVAAAGKVYFDENVDFTDPNNTGNKMIFKSSNNTNIFQKGQQITTGNWVFQGATDFVAEPGTKNTITNSQVYFTGNYDADSTDPEAAASVFTIDGGTDNLAIYATDSTLHLNKDVDIAHARGGSLAGLNTVMLGDDPTAKTRANTDAMLAAQFISIGDPGGAGNHGIAAPAVTVGNILIGQAVKAPAAAFTDGFQAADSITLNDKVLVEEGLFINAKVDINNKGVPVLIIGQAQGGFVLTDKAVDAQSYVDPDAVLQILQPAFDASNDVGVNKMTKIQVFSAAEGTTRVADYIAGTLVPEPLNIDTSNLGDNVKAQLASDGSVYYKALPGSGAPGVPKFAAPMVNALSNAPADLPIVGTYLGDGTEFSSTNAYNRELTMVMGNTMNSSLSLIHNGITHAFSHLNASVPTIAGYGTAAVAAPPRSAPASVPAPAVAPSPAIGIPIRADDVQPSAPMAPASGSDDGRPNGLWIAPSYAKTSVDGNYKEGYGDYDVKSMAVVMGYDKWVNENARLGAFLSYASPELDSDYQEISADDLQLGVYAQGVMPNGVILSGALAMGRQDYNSKRTIKFRNADMSGFNQELKADYNGKTFGAALEISRPVVFDNDIYMRPAFGYSYQNVSLDDVKEKTNVSRFNNLAQKISSDSFNVQQVRLGTDIGWVNPDNTVTVNGRAFLVANVGDTQPEGTASFISAGANGLPFKVRGAELDDAMANLGLGLKFTPADSEGLVISLDYDAVLGPNTQSHNVGLMLRYEF